jgi:hypothetical protein
LLGKEDQSLLKKKETKQDKAAQAVKPFPTSQEQTGMNRNEQERNQERTGTK